MSLKSFQKKQRGIRKGLEGRRKKEGEEEEKLVEEEEEKLVEEEGEGKSWYRERGREVDESKKARGGEWELASKYGKSFLLKKGGKSHDTVPLTRWPGAQSFACVTFVFAELSLP